MDGCVSSVKSSVVCLHLCVFWFDNIRCCSSRWVLDFWSAKSVVLHFTLQPPSHRSEVKVPPDWCDVAHGWSDREVWLRRAHSETLSNFGCDYWWDPKGAQTNCEHDSASTKALTARRRACLACANPCWSPWQSPSLSSSNGLRHCRLPHCYSCCLGLHRWDIYCFDPY